jgi:hypothetical protein
MIDTIKELSDPACIAYHDAVFQIKEYNRRPKLDAASFGILGKEIFCGYRSEDYGNGRDGNRALPDVRGASDENAG